MEEKKEDDLSIRTALIIVALIAILSFVFYKVMTSFFSLWLILKPAKLFINKNSW